ncbi:hypothetical protein JKF63_07759 [Porcisia hertigi]|uniref:Uncharacterized protein n=1 Tax=Porcisia hertigi TaxID=2761500 RepID=A0A836YGS8_9TRYP|nr:hypothetical protein JKF63_07759 [Porcisia hertigi]
MSASTSPSALRLPSIVHMINRRQPPAGSTAVPKHASKTKAAAAASSYSPPFQVFPDLPDQLMCSPDNSVWVYGQHSISLLASEATMKTKLKQKISCMMQEAQRHYDISCAFFHSLSSEEQMAEVLRASGGGTLVPPPPTNATSALTAGASVKRDHEGISEDNGSVGNKFDRKGLADAQRALRDAWPTWGKQDMNNPASNPVSREVESGDDVELSQNCYAPGLRVNLVLDIIASRKTLGPSPLSSQTYRLTEFLHRLILEPSTTQPPADSSPKPARIRKPPPIATTAVGSVLARTKCAHATKTVAKPAECDMALHVRSLVIGISDTDTILVGRHLVCPYRHLPTPTSTMIRLRRAIEAAADEEQDGSPLKAAVLTSDTAASPATATSGGLEGPEQVSAAAPESDTTTPSFRRVVSSQLARYHRIDALLPAPYGRVPPQSLDQIDQNRLILCAPPPPPPPPPSSSSIRMSRVG